MSALRPGDRGAVCLLVPQFQTQLSRSGGHAGERGIALAHTTILRWVQRYAPEFEKRWNQFTRGVGGSWWCDETYVKVKGEWVYLFRAVDK